MERKFESLSALQDVVSISPGRRIIIDQTTFKVSELINAVKKIISDYERVNNNPRGIWTAGKECWFTEGTECEVLKPGAQGWQKGRVRLTLELCPDENIRQDDTAANSDQSTDQETNNFTQSSEFPLDSIRQDIEQMVSEFTNFQL